MISPDLAETVKRLRERLAWSNRVEFQRPQGDGSTACKWEKPEAISSILDALEGLERDNASLRQKLAMIEAGYSPDAPKDMADVDRRLANLKHV